MELYVFHDGYTKVATIELPNMNDIPALEYGFFLTNSVHCPWTENESIKVEAIAKKGCRSSMVGDIFHIVRNNYTTAYKCCPSGWKKI